MAGNRDPDWTGKHPQIVSPTPPPIYFTQPAAEPTMSVTIQVSDIQAILGDFVKGGFAAFFEHLSESASWTLVNAAYPMGGKGDGIFGKKTKAEMWDFLNNVYLPIHDGMPNFDVTSITVTDNRAVLEVHVNGPLKTGKGYDNRMVWIFEFDADKKIIAVRDYIDSLLAFESITANRELQKSK